MSPRRVTLHEFRQCLDNTSDLAKEGSLVITEQGRPAYVFAPVLARDKEDPGLMLLSLADALAQPGEYAEFDFEPPRLNLLLQKDAI
jgi:hypothetical protein